MEVDSVMTTFRARIGLIALTAFWALAPASVAQQERQRAITIAIEGAAFAPINPAAPDGPSIAVLRGDPAAGPSDMLLRVGRGEGRLHAHTHDYRLVLISGRMRHVVGRVASDSDPVLGPGSYWFQPGGEAHADSCLDQLCVMFISWSG